MLDNVLKALAKIRKDISEAEASGLWPLSEADTERLVIEPLLTALGYSALDYRKRVAGAGGDFPDYTILPQYDQRWILEAKEWDARLDARAVRQAVNYARNNAAKWAVLTNGREWRLLSVDARVGLDGALAYHTDDILRDGKDAAEVLVRLAREFVLGGELDQDLRNREILAAVRAELGEPSRRVMRAVRDAVRERLDRNVGDEEVRNTLRAIAGEPAEERPEPGPVEPPPAVSDWIPITQLTRYEKGVSKRVGLVRLPDGRVVEVKYWCDVSQQVVVWICEEKGIPQLPFRASEDAINAFLNSAPEHDKGRRMKQARQIEVQGKTIWIDVNRGAAQHCSSLVALCEDRSIDPSAVKVKLSP